MGSVDILRKALDEASRHRTPKLISGRGCPPEETLARIQPLMSMAGITRIADVTGLDTIGVPVVMVVRPNARSLSVSQGKGLSIAAAKVSGIMESLECFHAERVETPIHIGRYADLAETHELVDPYALPRLPTSRFHSAMSIPWIEAVDLQTGQVRLVPFEIVSADFTFPGLPGTGFFGRSTNGLSSGNSLHEALIHGFCEVIERDAWALWHFSNGATGNTVELVNESDPRVVRMLEQFQTARCSVVVEEITSDVGVPVFFARLTGGGHGSPVTDSAAGGLGCHPDRTLALLRALCEAAQSRLTRIAGSRDDLVPRWYQNFESSPTQQAVKPAAAGDSGVKNEHVEEDYAWLDNRLTASGMTERLVVSLIDDRFRLPVVKVIVPGLEAPPELGCEPGSRARHYLMESREAT